MRFPRHLWTGEWRLESEQAREAAEQEAARRRAALAAAERESAQARSPRGAPRRTMSMRAVALVALAAAAIASGAFAAGALLTDSGPSAPPPLPAVSGKPVQPDKGQTQAGKIYAQASPAVVSIRTPSGSGTGFLVDQDGTLVTNAHVVGDSDRVVVKFGQDGRSIDGEVTGSDPSSDLAVVHIDPASAPRNAKPLQFADSRQVRVGDTAIAIGNPFGLDRTATEGIVSGIGRHITAPNGFSIDEVIQTDAPINPGNSGGPLLDETARVIGVNSQIATSGASQGNVGIGFAVPANTVREVVPRLKKGDRIARPWLGVETSDSTNPAAPAGAEVQSVTPGGPADGAGLSPGDVITEIDGQPVDDPDDVSRLISGKQPGDHVDMRVDRSGQEVSLGATLGNRPARTP
ncbi:MAG TPA: trypsin-like peptidase domain-containing protein [Solirubrobacteraceae bacterium]